MLLMSSDLMDILTRTEAIKAVAARSLWKVCLRALPSRPRIPAELLTVRVRACWIIKPEEQPEPL